MLRTLLAVVAGVITAMLLMFALEAVGLMRAALAVATLIVIGVVMNAMAIPHPLWMNALGVLLPVPMALLGARLTRRTPATAA